MRLTENEIEGLRAARHSPDFAHIKHRSRAAILHVIRSYPQTSAINALVQHWGSWCLICRQPAIRALYKVPLCSRCLNSAFRRHMRWADDDLAAADFLSWSLSTTKRHRQKALGLRPIPEYPRRIGSRQELKYIWHTQYSRNRLTRTRLIKTLIYRLRLPPSQEEIMLLMWERELNGGRIDWMLGDFYPSTHLDTLVLNGLLDYDIRFNHISLHLFPKTIKAAVRGLSLPAPIPFDSYYAKLAGISKARARWLEQNGFNPTRNPSVEEIRYAIVAQR
jgi:hypothetical protein